MEALISIKIPGSISRIELEKKLKKIARADTTLLVEACDAYGRRIFIAGVGKHMAELLKDRKTLFSLSPPLRCFDIREVMRMYKKYAKKKHR
ncbi:MAG: hypothetical protein A3H69_05855 [Candidatus Sungbacteria bacterium RIFCSPLOWO2_02_FULL_47_9]|uniref:Uncharacterized protein n=1 Tax=Candidatus Sungbacteria bacterium RIFCSPHIGHO2_01_FULL_47_32 TaxID=1802264 RepID=A0A1G2K4T3_9BACT|nr:MAG: hypothetical protein UX72_C0017G0034 [Parcubacteria group bacterium GW2011_GWA2_47_10]OGZ93611.1 MAG: hypothetical protein A2633_04630 [Candidatus Sungbacteria bacterium RIFCSPHIGHO2_01_FULL_47_32]OHA05453.1 MAG: hypothetical protein A3A28_03090 [Candidatus Sungbacteria bacterium RIFCSPLOWO2_01_FULL_47_32]OHA08669.1 MAG: hypothetical protein A3H69_05855 [Candidatus Sungbacteria bacterium RIFCSPLOWO2_02_FULL_47_9]